MGWCDGVMWMLLFSWCAAIRDGGREEDNGWWIGSRKRSEWEMGRRVMRDVMMWRDWVQGRCVVVHDGGSMQVLSHYVVL